MRKNSTFAKEKNLETKQNNKNFFFYQNENSKHNSFYENYVFQKIGNNSFKF